MKKEDVKKIKKTLGFVLLVLGLFGGSLETLMFMDGALGMVILVGGIVPLGFWTGCQMTDLDNQGELKLKDLALGFTIFLFGLSIGMAACHYLPLGVVIAFLGILVSSKILTDAPLKVSLSVVKKDTKELFSDG